MPLRSLGNSQIRIRTKKTRNAPAPHASSFSSGAMGLGPSFTVSVPAVSPTSVSTAVGSLVAVLSSVEFGGTVWINWTVVTAPDCVTTAVSTSSPCGVGGSEADEDEDHEADEGQGFGEGDTEEHGRTNHAGGLGLTGHRLDGLADEVTDADARSDRRQTVGEAGADRSRRGLVGVRLLLVKAGLDDVAQCFHWLNSPVFCSLWEKG